MYASVNWLNEYLDPPADADEQASLLTRAGFPLEGRQDFPNGDIQQDFEMTSNRGDCVCHVGLAREIAAISSRTLKLPKPNPKVSGSQASEVIKVTNNEPKACPRYTARVIRGLKVGPSPKWLADRLTAINQIPRNNLVDATNFVLFELGQPTHVFDLAKLQGSKIIVRMANKDEPFLPIGEGEKSVKLSAQDLVIADANRAVAIAGVKGGAETAVTDTTTDIVIEAATFNRVMVRNTSRRLNIASDSSYRFERGVHAGQVDNAADRLAELILELCGGELCEGVIADGDPIPDSIAVSMRPQRCRKILGVEISTEQMLKWLDALEFQPTVDGDVINCLAPIYRFDIEREIDLIEEVSRMFGHDNIPVTETMQIRIAPPQSIQLARQAIANALVGMGFVETITHSLISDKAAEPFVPKGTDTLRVDDDRAKAEPMLRPSIIPSLLRIRRHNRVNGVQNLKLFESASTFGTKDGGHYENFRIAMTADIDDGSEGLRSMRGVVNRLAEVLLGPDASVEVEQCSETTWLQPGAIVKINGKAMGILGILSREVATQFDLDSAIAVTELDLPELYENYPPEREAHALPTFPTVERDISAIVAEELAWAKIDVLINKLNIQLLEAVEFVTTYRGKQIGSGKKSVTLRLRFRAPNRTLTHEDVDVQFEQVINALKSQLKAEIRK